MVTIFVDYDTVKEEYPQESNDLIELLRNSKSSSKNEPVEKIKWMYAYSYFKNKGTMNEEYYEKLYAMPFEERLEEEISKVRVTLSMKADKFAVSDRVLTVSDKIKEAVKYVTIQKMITEQSVINNNDVIDSIPIPKEEQIPLTLDEQLKRAIDEEDYIEAARIRDLMKNSVE